MKIGVSSYSYSRLVRAGQMKQIEVIAKAKEMGFDVIEFSTVSVPEGEALPGFAAQLREEAARVGIEIANYTIGADFLKGSGGDLAAEIERVKGEVDIAEILGVPGMRHDASGGFAADHAGPKSFDAGLCRLADGCRAVTQYAADKGIRTMVENHGHFCQDSLRVEKLVTAVDHANFGVLIDMGNFICVDDDPGVAVGRLMPYAFHCHAKDFHLKSGIEPFPGSGWALTRAGNYRRGAVIGHGNVPVIQCLRVMYKAGYDGVLSIEFEGIEEVINGIQLGHDNLRRFVTLVEQGY
ncbi:MAG: sugar phosphate isomerase/epimerase [Lentisphaerae bacterium]|nr:sugar phosphate isomerase/epimerase [Lentisphaerota bacterium]MBT5606230.1 sugar phosphate isomerase/epimerase [Lentisphaerota bacterium]MBT7058645.1 sugar phosphate isomerase/epimerase [Lentisphaerota bacterium]MBT7848743.1 sugar phosphate isomerase/epimerase [Lentisphaerota bacterium]